jgi:hypothetical protein
LRSPNGDGSPLVTLTGPYESKRWYRALVPATIGRQCCWLPFTRPSRWSATAKPLVRELPWQSVRLRFQAAGLAGSNVTPLLSASRQRPRQRRCLPHALIATATSKLARAGLVPQQMVAGVDERALVARLRTTRRPPVLLTTPPTCANLRRRGPELRLDYFQGRRYVVTTLVSSRPRSSSPTC